MRSVVKVMFAGVLLVGLLSSQIFAQGMTGTKYEIGIKGGISWSGLYGSGINSFNNSLAASPTLASSDPRVLPFPMFNAFAAYYLIPDFIAVQPELMWERFGNVWKIENTAGSASSLRVRSDYISIPILAKLVLPLDLPVTPNLYFGPRVAFKINSQAENFNTVPTGTPLGFTSGFASSSKNTDIGADVKPVDFGFSTGIGANLAAGPGSIVLDARYTFGLAQVFNVVEAKNSHNQAFGIMAGYSLRF